jgi:hypothetical protein
MPQLVKGGKWVFGWVVVGNQQEIIIPPDALAEYGFKSGEPVSFLHGSLRSGGFSIGRLEKLKKSKVPIQQRAFARGKIRPGGQVVLPMETGTQPGDRLLVVRGSGLALGFLIRGPIYEEALKHSEIETFFGHIQSAG